MLFSCLNSQAGMKIWLISVFWEALQQNCCTRSGPATRPAVLDKHTDTLALASTRKVNPVHTTLSLHILTPVPRPQSSSEFS